MNYTITLLKEKPDFDTDPTVKAKWIAALKSGEYNQGVNKLCHRHEGKNYYCCLGVLASECQIPYEAYSESFIFNEKDAYDSYLPEHFFPALKKEGDFSAWAIVSREEDGRAFTSLAELNDSGVPFGEIAYIIDKLYN